jgi:hypothetical protein
VRLQQAGNEPIAYILTPMDGRGWRGQSRLSLCCLRVVVIFVPSMRCWPSGLIGPTALSSFRCVRPPSFDVSPTTCFAVWASSLGGDRPNTYVKVRPRAAKTIAALAR